MATETSMRNFSSIVALVKLCLKEQAALICVWFSIVPFSAIAQGWSGIGSLSEAKTNFEIQQIGPDQAIAFGGNRTGNACIALPTRSCDIIDVRSRSVRRSSPMMFARCEFASVVTSDTIIYAVSGLSNEVDLTPTVEKYNQSTDQWEVVGNLAQARRQHAAVLVDNRYIVVVGGRDEGLRTLNSAEVFDVTTGRSRLIANYPFAVNNPGAVLNSAGVAWFFGGRAGNQFSAQSQDLHQYSFQSDRWIKVGEIGVDTETFTLLKLFDGRICVSGGMNQNGFEANSQILVERDTSLPIFANMSRGLLTHGVGQIDDTTLIVFGGSAYTLITGHVVNTTSEFISLTSGRSTPAPGLNEPRRLLESITLPKVCEFSGRQSNVVIAAGGFTATNQTSSSVEIWETPSSCCSRQPAASTIKGVINQYYSVQSIDYGKRAIEVDSVPELCAGDLALLIQMQGAEVDLIDNPWQFGKVTRNNSAGEFEVVQVKEAFGTSVQFVNPFKKQYQVSGAVQLVTFPQLTSVRAIDTLKALPWNGVKGGVFALVANDSIVLQAPIVVTGQGFRGGRASNSTTFSGNQEYGLIGSLDSTKNSRKGEGSFRASSESQKAGRGPLASAGGGGNNHNAGGGGGANGGCGGSGGYAWYILPGLRENAQGLGGYAYENADARLYLGGGGGAGHGNELSATSGGNGGGIVFLISRRIVARDSKIEANGDSSQSARFDGVGGGGAGGSVAIGTVELIGDLTVEAKGGNGGSVLEHIDGPGGGGGGGVIRMNQPHSIRQTLSGGQSGKIRTGESYGATAGCSGISGVLVAQGYDLPTSVIREFSHEGHLLYPNPTTGYLTVVAGGKVANEVYQIEVLDMLGHQLVGVESQSPITSLDCSHLPIGTYLLSIIASGGKTERVRFSVHR